MPTVDRDKGRLALLLALSDADNAHADVGLFEGEAHEGTDLTMAEIGAVHEYGTRDGHVPERSWLRSNHDKHWRRYGQMLDEGYSKILAGKASVFRVLHAIGEKVASDVRKNLTDVREPPLAASTIRKKKGKTNPLIDTGALRAAIRSRVVLRGFKVT
jgi:hypothetical protein